LDCLQVESAKGAIRLCCVWERLEKAGEGDLLLLFAAGCASNFKSGLGREIDFKSQCMFGDAWFIDFYEDKKALNRFKIMHTVQISIAVHCRNDKGEVTKGVICS